MSLSPALASYRQALNDLSDRGRLRPTVPEGTARLRIALTLHADERAVAGLFEALAEESRVLAA